MEYISSFDGMLARASISLMANDAAFDDARLEGILRIVLGVLAQRLGQRDRIAAGVGDRGHAGEVLHRLLDRSALRGPLGQRVLDYAIVAACAAYRFAELEILLHRQLGKCAYDGVARVLKLFCELARPVRSSSLW